MKIVALVESREFFGGLTFVCLGVDFCRAGGRVEASRGLGVPFRLSPANNVFRRFCVSFRYTSRRICVVTRRVRLSSLAAWK